MSNLGGKINFQLGYSIDKSALDALTKEFDRITIAATKPGKNLSQSLKEAREAANVLGSSMKAAFDINKGSVNLSKFNSYISQSGKSMSQLSQNLTKAGINGEGAFAKLNSSLMTANTTITKTQTAFGKMTDTFLSAAYWGAAYRAINSISSGISNAVKYVEELDTSLNKIRIVTGDSAEKMEQFAISANKAAQSLGASTKAYVDASLIFYEQGLSDKEVEARTNITMKVANVTDLNAEEAAENLTAVWNGFKISTEDAEKVIDQLAAVAANSASNLGELSTAMSKVASAASTMGVGTEQLTAMLATVEEATRQAPESIGTAYKTIFARMGDLKTDGVDEFGTTLGEVSTQMKTMGIDIIDDTGAMKDMGQVVEETAEAWKGWSREQKQAAAIAMAGKRQYNNLFALFENWDRYTENLDVATNSLGTLQKQQDTYLESTAAKLKQVQAQWEEFYSNLIDSDALKLFIGGFEQIVKQINNLTTTPFGALVPIFSTLAMLLNGKISKGLTNFVTGNTKAVQQARELKVLEESIAATKARYESSGGISAKTVLSSQMSANAGGNIAEATAIANLKKQALSLQKEMTIEEQQTLNTLIKQTGEEQKQQILRAKEIQDALNKYNVNNQQLKVENEEVNTTKLRSEFFDLTTKSLEKQVGLLLQGETLNQKDLNAITKKAEILETSLNIGLENLNAKKQELETEVETFKLEEEETKIARDLISLDIEQLETIDKEAIIYRNVIRELQRITNLTEKIVTENENIATSTESIGIKLSSLKQYSDLSNIFSGLINSTTGIILGLTSLASVINTFNDDDIAPFEKFTQISLSLGIGLPMAISGFTSLVKTIKTVSSATKEAIVVEETYNFLRGQGVKKEIAEKAAIELKNIAIDEENFKKLENIGVTNAEVAATRLKYIQDRIGTEAIWSKVAAMIAEKAAAHPLLIIGGLLAASAIAVAYAISKETTEREKHQKQLEKDTKILNEQNDVLKNIKTSYDDLKSSIESLKDAKNNINEMTEGTQEWNDAVYSLNQQVLELINKYPKLLNYLSKDEKGIFSIRTEGFNEILQDTQNAIQLQQANVLESQAKTLMDQSILNQDDLIKIVEDNFNLVNDTKTLSKSVAEAIVRAYENSNNIDSFKESLKENLGEHSTTENIVKQTVKYYDKISSLIEESNNLQKQSRDLSKESMVDYLNIQDSNFKNLEDTEKNAISSFLASKENVFSVEGESLKAYDWRGVNSDVNLYEGRDTDKDEIGEDNTKVRVSALREYIKTRYGYITEETDEFLEKIGKNGLSALKIYEEQLGKNLNANAENKQITDESGNVVGEFQDDEAIRKFIADYLNKNIKITQLENIAKDIIKNSSEAFYQFLDKEGVYDLSQYSQEEVKKLSNKNFTEKEKANLEKADLDAEKIKEEIDKTSQIYFDEIKNINSTFPTLTDGMRNILNQMVQDQELSLSQIRDTAKLFSKAGTDESQKTLTDFYSKVSPELQAKITEVIGEVDNWTGMTTDELSDKFEAAGIEVDNLSSKFDDLIEVMQNMSFATNALKYNVDNVAAGLKAYKEFAQDIKAGETLSSSDYKNLIKTLDTKTAEKVSSLFTQTVDGKYMYIGADASELQTALMGSGTLDLKTVLENTVDLQEKFLEGYGKEGETSAAQFGMGYSAEGELLTDRALADAFYKATSEKVFSDFFADNAQFQFLKGINIEDYLNENGELKENIKTMIEDIQTQWGDFLKAGLEGQYDIEKQKDVFYQSSEGLGNLRGTALLSSEDEEYEYNNKQYQNARKVILQENLDLLDSSLSAEQAYEEQLRKENKTLGDLKRNSEEYNNILKDISGTQFLIKNGVTSLSKIWNNTYKDAEKGTKEWSQAIDESAKAVSAMFGQNVDSEFIVQNFDAVRAAANGDTEAIKALQDALTKKLIYSLDIDDNSINELYSFMSELNDLKAEPGVSLDTTDFDRKWLASLQNMYDEGLITINQLSELFQNQDWSLAMTKDGKIDIKNTRKLGASNLNYIPDYEAGLGKSDRNKKEYTYNYIEKAEYDGDIYHNINEKLENIERTMSRLETHQDDLWGSQALKNINKINDALKSNINLLEKRIKVGRKDLSEKKGQLIADFNVQFDKNGNISNYNKVYDKLYKSREKLRRKYNAMSAEAQSKTAGKQLKKDIEVYDKRIDLYKKEAEAYEKIYDQIENDRSKIDELHRKEIENALKKIDLSIELKVEPSEIQRSFRDFLNKTQVADNDFASISKMQLKDYKSYGKEIKERQKQISKLTKSLKNFQEAGKDKTFNNGLKDAKDKLKDLIKDQEQALITLSELESSMIETMNNNFSELSKNFDKINEKYDNIMSNINHFSDITKLLLGEDNYAAQEKFFKQRDIANRSQIKSLKNQLKIYEAERINIENKIAKETNEKQKQNLQNNLDTINSQITQMQNQLQSSINETFQNLIDGYKNSIDAIFKEVELELTNGLGIDTVQDGIKKTKDYSDEWLDDVQKIYEINKLTAAYDDAARKETELGLQNKILQAKREEIALLQKQGKLEQYDIDRANAKLNLLLKEIALQEARENKTKLRLRRDAQGNYSYQYTANQEDIDKARQEYEDALYKLNELDQKQRLSLNDRLLTLETDWTKALQEVYEDYSMPENEKEQRIANINEYYEKERDNLLEGNDEILRNLYESSLVYFNKENETYFKSYDEMTQEWKDKFNDFIYGPQGLIPNQKNGFGLMKTDMNSWKTSFSSAINSAESKNKEFKDDLDSVAKLAGETYQKILKGEEDGNAGIEDVKSATEELETATKDLGTEYENTSTKINKAWNELQSFQEKINEQKYTKAIKEASKLAAAMGKVKTQADKATKSTKSVKAAAASKTETYVPIDTSNGDGGGSPDSGNYNLTEYNSKKTKNKNLVNKKIQKGDKVKWTNPANPYKINHSEFDLYRDSALGSKQQNWLGKFFKNAGSQKVNSLPSSNEAKVIGYKNGKVKIEFKAMTQSLKEIGKPLGWSYRTVKGWISEKTFKDRFTGYDTGGYTGSWNSKDGKLALLHEKELVLNKQDTSNMLKAINQLRDIQSTLGLNANDVLNSIIKDFTTTLKGMNINNSKATNQNITISANFPNAVDRFEIEAAFDSLEARASQYAWSKDLDA